MSSIQLRVLRRVEFERPAMREEHGVVLEMHHDYAAALSLKRFHTLTCAFPETLNMFVCCASFNPQRVEIKPVRGMVVIWLLMPLLCGCCWRRRWWRDDGVVRCASRAPTHSTSH